jgi:hypothetical protein
MITYYDHVGEARARAPEGLERHDMGVAQSDKRGGAGLVAGKPTKVVSVRTVQRSVTYPAKRRRACRGHQ